MAINFDYFGIIEKAGSSGITATEFAERAGNIDVQVARNWLSKWCSRDYLSKIKYQPDPGAPTGYTTVMPPKGRPRGTESRYVLGRNNWATLMSRRIESLDDDQSF